MPRWLSVQAVTDLLAFVQAPVPKAAGPVECYIEREKGSSMQGKDARCAAE